MLLIRRFEEKAGQLYGMGLIGGFCHLYIGQEAVVVGMQMAKRRRSGHNRLPRSRPHAGLRHGTQGRDGGTDRPPRRLFQGQGRLHAHVQQEKNFFGGHGIVGAQVSLGTGLAFANRYRGNDIVSLTYFGDGASNQGQVYESFNMAELWKLPVIYVIENNRYAMGTSVTRSSAQTDFSKRGMSFNIPGEQVDGMDVRAVKAAGDEAVAWCRAGKGPIILEMQTYRYRGHSMSDPAKYRTREEVDKVRNEQDPIEQVRERLLAKKMGERGELKAIDAEVREIVNEAADFATARSRARSVRTLHRHLSLSMRVSARSPRCHARSRYANSSADARAVADHGEGQPRQMAEEGRRDDQVRRRHRRDRDRQGDDGSRGDRRGHARQDPDPRRHRRRRGQHADRDHPRRRRGQCRAQVGKARRAPARQQKAAESAPPAGSEAPSRRKQRRSRRRRAKTGTVEPPKAPPSPIPRCPKAPRW